MSPIWDKSATRFMATCSAVSKPRRFRRRSNAWHGHAVKEHIDRRTDGGQRLQGGGVVSGHGSGVMSFIAA